MKEAEKRYAVAVLSNNGLALIRLTFIRRFGRPTVTIDRQEAGRLNEKLRVLGRKSVEWFVYSSEHGNLHAHCLVICY